MLQGLRLLGNQAITEDGFLSIAGSDVRSLALGFGTPLYVVDEPYFRENIRRFLKVSRAAHSDLAVTFASKSNSVLAVLQIAKEEGLGVDVASEGELMAALKAGFDPGQIHLHGNNKSDRELDLAIEHGLGAVMVDSFSEIERLEAKASGSRTVVRCIVRLSPNVDPATHEAIRTGQADTKFGFNIGDGSALRASQIVHESASLHLVGYHTHVGSQLLDASSAVEGAAFIAEFAVAQPFDLEEICVGGGLGIAYLPTMAAEPMESYLAKVIQAALTPFDHLGRPRPRLSFEPGRCLIGEPGTTLYQAGPIKVIRLENGSARRYLSVNGGIADNPRPLLYAGVYNAINASRMHEAHDVEFTVASRHCENDTMIRSALLPGTTQEGDLIAVQCTGAYGASMASNYNRYPRPAMVLVGNGEFLAVHRETVESLFANEELRDGR